MGPLTDYLRERNIHFGDVGDTKDALTEEASEDKTRETLERTPGVPLTALPFAVPPVLQHPHVSPTIFVNNAMISMRSHWFQGASAGMGYSIDPPKPLNLPTRQQVDTIRAYKRAGILYADPTYTTLTLCGAGSSQPYKPDDTAICARLRDHLHEAPDENCTCGFYAVEKDRLKLLAMEYQFTCCWLEVELWGKIVCHKNGWRGQHQRVLAVHLDSMCDLCTGPAAAIAALGGLFASLCDAHLSTTSHGLVVTPVELANQWGVEVGWA